MKVETKQKILFYSLQILLTSTVKVSTYSLAVVLFYFHPSTDASTVSIYTVGALIWFIHFSRDTICFVYSFTNPFLTWYVYCLFQLIIFNAPWSIPRFQFNICIFSLCKFWAKLHSQDLIYIKELKENVISYWLSLVFIKWKFRVHEWSYILIISLS